MKYIVEVTTSNPSHEHMALRRVQKKTNFVVEASNEAEALMRARGKFRSLGHYVHDVQLVEQQVNERISLGAPVSDQLKAKEKLAKSMEDKPDTAVARIDKSIENTKDKDPEYSKRVSAFKDEYLKKKKEADAGETTLVAKEEVEYIEEVLKASDPASKWISDFVASDNPRFKGKSKKERIRMALGAYYTAKRATNEEVEQIDEIKKATLMKYVQKAVGEIGQLGYDVGRSHGLRDAGILDDEIDADEEDRNQEKLEKRTKGVARASAKLAKEEVEQIDEGVTHWEYTGTVNGKEYSLTIPRGDDLINHLNHKKIMRQNPHLEPHEAKAVAETSGDDEEHVEVEHGGKKYTHYVTNDQEPRMYYSEEVEHIEEGKGYAPGWMLKKDKNLGAKVKEKIDLAKKRQASYGKPKAGVSVKEEVVAESEGRVAVTPKEKALAAHHGDPKRITYGDVVKARIKSGKKKIEEADASKPVMSIADRVKARQDAKKAEAKAKDDAEAIDYLKSKGMSDANIAKRMEKPVREQAAPVPVPNPNAVPKKPKEPKEPGTTDYTKELELDPSFPSKHPLELERPAVEAEVRKRQAELAKQAAEKAKLKKEEVQIDEIVSIVGKIVKAAVKKGDDVVKQVPAARVGTEKTMAKAAEVKKADVTFQATGGAQVPDVKKMSADEYKAYYDRKRLADKAKKTDLPSNEPTPPVTPPPAAPGARVIDLEKRRVVAVSPRSSQNPYAKLANEQRTLMTYEKGEKQKSKPAEPGMETTMDTETKGQTETQMDKEVKTKNMAQKLIDLAKSKLNKINTKPEMDADVKGK